MKVVKKHEVHGEDLSNQTVVVFSALETESFYRGNDKLLILAQAMGDSDRPVQVLSETDHPIAWFERGTLTVLDHAIQLDIPRPSWTSGAVWRFGWKPSRQRVMVQFEADYADRFRRLIPRDMILVDSKNPNDFRGEFAAVPTYGFSHDAFLVDLSDKHGERSAAMKRLVRILRRPRGAKKLDAARNRFERAFAA